MAKNYDFSNYSTLFLNNHPNSYFLHPLEGEALSARILTLGVGYIVKGVWYTQKSNSFSQKMSYLSRRRALAKALAKALENSLITSFAKARKSLSKFCWIYKAVIHVFFISILFFWLSINMLNFNLLFIKFLTSTHPLKDCLKLRFKMKAFFSHRQISFKVNISGDSQKYWNQSQPQYACKRYAYK